MTTTMQETFMQRIVMDVINKIQLRFATENKKDRAKQFFNMP